jgi:hypothetical protein
MDKSNEIKKLNDNSLLEEQANLETKEDITPDKELELLYFNLLNDKEVKIPKLNETQNIFKLLQFIFNKSYEQNIKEIPETRKKQILNHLISKLIDKIGVNDETYLEKMKQYFSFVCFFNTFFEILLKEDILVFKDKFLYVSKVSKYSFKKNFFLLDDSVYFKR